MAEKKKAEKVATEKATTVKLVAPAGTDAVSFGDKAWKVTDGHVEAAPEDVAHLLGHGCKFPNAPEPVPEPVNGPAALLAEDEDRPT